MRASVSTLLLLIAAPTGCGLDAEVAEENLVHRIRWTQAAETEIQDCHVFKLPNTRTVEVDRLQVKFASGSHHVHIYRSSEPVADEVFDCFNGIDWSKWSLVIGAQTQAMDWQLPEGVTVPFEPHQQLLAQVHWLNTNDKPETAQIDLSFHTTEDSQEHLGVVFGVNQRVRIPALSRDTRVEHFCQMPEGAKLHAMMGHFHARGRDYRVLERRPAQADGTEVYFAKDEPSFEFKMFSPARPVAPGAGFEYQCGFDNSGNAIDLTWGSDTQTQEHCNMTAYFSPAEKISEMCVLEPSKLSGVNAPEAIATGKVVTMEVTLAAAEPTDVDVLLASSDRDALSVPSSVRIPAGELKASFTAHTLRPARVEVSAELNGAKLIKPVRVTGLVLSEIFYSSGTGASDDLQWIEIANTSDTPINLAGYSIGAGKNSFMTTQLGLPIEIQAKGCIVVGGTQRVPANHEPDLAIRADLSPDLDLGESQAAGVGLFSAQVQTMSPALLPLDVVVYGSANAENLGGLRDVKGNIASVWPGSIPGGSIVRAKENVWKPVPANEVSPGYCEVLYAM